jgi:DNA mismatch repair protein MutL
MAIQLLPISLANQIAAGEVIERPSSVVKELVENSLDAGADAIVIDVEQGGRRRIRIRDNGSGIAQHELALALSRHATSKIRSLADLEAILSMGFRGEALASISSVARLTLTSKTAEQAEAWEAWVEGRDMTAQIQPASHPNGTTVDVQDLFFNTPARRKFLRTDKTEFAHIDEVVKRLALARFDVRFSLNHNQKLVRQYPAVSTDRGADRVARVCGAQFIDEAAYVDETAASWRLWGWISPPQACRHQADVQYFYVNGRMLKDRLLGHAIRQAYGDQLGDERSPTFVLYLELPASEVDVNVHPAKHEVRFQQARQIHDFILQALRPLLLRSPDRAPFAAMPQAVEATTVAANRADWGTPPQHHYRPAAADIAAQLQALQPASRTPLPAVMEAAPRPVAVQHAAGLEPSAQWRVLTVVQQRFALIQRLQPERGEAPLLLLDLQRIQQRALADHYAEQFHTGLAGQPLLIPVQLSSSAAIAQAQQLPASMLARLGILLEWQRKQCIVKQVPSALRQTNINQTLPCLLAQLLERAGDADQLPVSIWLWLAQLQVSSSYSATQAEHWLQRWLSWQQPQHLVQVLPLPQLPEPLQ